MHWVYKAHTNRSPSSSPPNTLCSSTINTPRQRAAEEKPPEAGAALAGEHREPLSWQGHGEARDKGSSVFGKRYRDSQAHAASFSHLQLEGTAQLRDLRWKAPRKRRWEFSRLSEPEAPARGSSHSQPRQCQDLAPVKPTQSELSTRAKLVVFMQPTLRDEGQAEN